MNKRISKNKFNHFSTTVRLLTLVLLWLGSSSSLIAFSVGCDDEYVQMANDKSVINVAASGLNDTVNIQCALDAAASMEISTVRLTDDDYLIAALTVENFKGTLEGRTKASTSVKVMDNSIDCIGMIASGRLSAAIKFIKGEPRVRQMTISADRSCAGGSFIDTILHFTGDSTESANCDNDVIFGVVDRVIIDGTSIDTGPWAAIEVAPEGRLLGGCKDTLLGSFKLNRSTIQNIYSGVVTNMRSGAQVDISTNEFHDNGQAVNLFDTNQKTNITDNKFFGDNTAEDDYRGVYVTNWSDTPPPKSRLVVDNNEFNISSSFDENWSYAILMTFDFYGAPGIISDIGSVITNNRFNLDGNDVYAVRFRDASNTQVSSNRFNGSGRRAIYVNGDSQMSNWTITANTGLAGFTSADTEDIRLGSNTTLSIVGAKQGASVLDESSDNTVLPQ